MVMTADRVVLVVVVEVLVDPHEVPEILQRRLHLQTPPAAARKTPKAVRAAATAAARTRKDRKKKNKKQSKTSKKQLAKQKKKEKEKAKAVKAKEKAQSKEFSQKQSLATSALYKLTPMVLALTATLSHPQSLMLPEVVLNTAKNAMTQLQDMEKRCKLIIDGNASTDLGFSKMQEVTQMIGGAKKAEALVKQMMATVNKLSV